MVPTVPHPGVGLVGHQPAQHSRRAARILHRFEHLVKFESLAIDEPSGLSRPAPGSQLSPGEQPPLVSPRRHDDRRRHDAPAGGTPSDPAQHADTTPVAATPPWQRSERKHRDFSTPATAVPPSKSTFRPRRRSSPTAKPQQNALPGSLHETRRRAWFDASRPRHKRTRPGRIWLSRGARCDNTAADTTTSRKHPACAGNSIEPLGGNRQSAGHPCVCGEQPAWPSKTPEPHGSSLRVRGTAAALLGDRIAVRVIPACAGNRGARRDDLVRRTCHPCVCGEQCEAVIRSYVSDGSSLRVRGTDSVSWCTIECSCQIQPP